MDLKKNRLTMGFTQQKISDIMGINIKLWQKWEQGSQGISAAPLKFFKLIVVLSNANALDKFIKMIK